MSLPDAIVWDLDGTLVDTAPDLTTAINTVLDLRGFASLPLGTVRKMIGNGIPKLVERGFNAIGVRLEPGHLEKLVAMFMQAYTSCATEHSRPYPLVVEVLTQICAMNIPMGVCTNKPEAISRQILNDLGMSVYFDSVVGGDTTDELKPAPQPLLTCLLELVAAPHASLMIGDSGVDVQTARTAQVSVAAVPWGYRQVSAERLGADLVLHHLADLPELLGGGMEKRSDNSYLS